MSQILTKSLRPSSSRKILTRPQKAAWLRQHPLLGASDVVQSVKQLLHHLRWPERKAPFSSDRIAKIKPMRTCAKSICSQGAPLVSARLLWMEQWKSRYRSNTERISILGATLQGSKISPWSVTISQSLQTWWETKASNMSLQILMNLSLTIAQCPHATLPCSTWLECSFGQGQQEVRKMRWTRVECLCLKNIHQLSTMPMNWCGKSILWLLVACVSTLKSQLWLRIRNPTQRSWPKYRHSRKNQCKTFSLKSALILR